MILLLTAFFHIKPVFFAKNGRTADTFMMREMTAGQSKKFNRFAISCIPGSSGD
jgi:hypothetical protein